MIRNKARLVAQRYTQEKRIDYDEVFAPVARIKAIRLFLDYASFKDFVVYQMDVKSVFLYRKIEEEVYVCQPLGFEDPDFPNRVYKVEKALYGLHQAPSAWYETLSTYLFDNEFQRGKIDKTLFIKRYKDVKTASTLMETQKPLLKDEDGEEVDVHIYQVNPKVSRLRAVKRIFRYLKGQQKLGLWYPKDSPFDLEAYTDSDYAGASLDRKSTIEALCACARYQVNPKVSRLRAVKKIFRYLKGQQKLGLWYPKDYPFDLEAYIDSDYAGASLDRKSTTRGKAKKSVKLMMKKLFRMELELMLAKTINGEVQLHALVYGKKIIITESTIRRDLQLEDAKGVDCLPNSTIFE
ncbi:putative ribonuclease H-like domain-containing protein [Tanacetum coccineum]|uniref:Ribonuclease H-like domain-containing protein n=1 Tax=Tanacetum coccineum TaxID=301880 RepID=A0ABQ5FP80_9ASTR